MCCLSGSARFFGVSRSVLVSFFMSPGCFPMAFVIAGRITVVGSASVLNFVFLKFGTILFVLSLDSFRRFERPARSPFPCRVLWRRFLPLLGGGGGGMPSFFAFS